MKRWEKQKNINEGKMGIFTQKQFLLNSFLICWCLQLAKSNNRRHLEFSTDIYISIYYTW